MMQGCDAAKTGRANGLQERTTMPYYAMSDDDFDDDFDDDVDDFDDDDIDDDDGEDLDDEDL